MGHDRIQARVAARRPGPKRSSAARQPGSGRSARARGLRTLQHQTLSTSVCYAIDTEVWFRSLVLAEATPSARERRWATKDQVHDEALAWFLDAHAERAEGQMPTRAKGAGGEDLTFWVDARLLERARRVAAREGLRLAQLIEGALSAYVEQHIPPELVRFRRRMEAQACRLYRRARVRAAGRISAEN